MKQENLQLSRVYSIRFTLVLNFRLETLGKGWLGRGNGISAQGCWVRGRWGDRELNFRDLSFPKHLLYRRETFGMALLRGKEK